jgi:hypothetical protein
MPNARTIALALAALALASCHKQQTQVDQNFAVTNEIPGNADIETLPPDETAGTPADQLENGNDNADVADLNASQNSY